MALHDGDIADLARAAADAVDPALAVHIAPAANDDPYRWGSSGWTVTVDTPHRVHVWIPADASPQWVLEEITRRVRADAG